MTSGNKAFGPDGMHRLEPFIHYVLYQTWTIMLGSFWFFIQLEKSSPERSNLSTRQIAEMVDRGQSFFVEPSQRVLFFAGLWGSLAVFFAVGLITQVLLGREALAAFHKKAFAFAVLGGVLFWVLAPRLI